LGLAVLPEEKPSWSRVGVSAAFQVSVVGFFLLVSMIYPQAMTTAVHYYTSTPLAQPVTEIPVAPPAPAKVKAVAPKVEKPAPIEPIKLNPQQAHIFANLAAPKLVKPRIAKSEPKVPDLSSTLNAVKIETREVRPKRPREEVKMGNLSTGSAAPPTVVASVEKVQTGGFGDPNGMAGKGDPNHATNVNRLGSAALPGGEGYGNGTGGKNGIRGTVESTGFGNGTAIPPPSGGGKKGAVAPTAFASAADMSAAEAPKKNSGLIGPADTPPDILSKPRPEYTAEGHMMKIEGDVVIDLVFLANGSIQISRVVSGLGHGLDDTAVRAAQQIKFKPAKRQGEPVDFPARVRIEFRLAY
jgi:TonB family protein